jgi:hypothetical protein
MIARRIKLAEPVSARERRWKDGSGTVVRISKLFRKSLAQSFAN